MTKSKKKFFSIKSFIRENTLKLIIVCILSIIAVCISVIYPYSMKFLIDNVLIKRKFNIFNMILLIMFASIIVQIIMNFLVSILTTKISQNYIFKLKMMLIKKVINLPLIKQNNGSLNTLINSDFEQIGDLLVNILIIFFTSALTVFIYLIALLSLNKLLTIVLIIFIPLSILLNIVIGKKVQKYYYLMQSSLDNINVNISKLKKSFLLIHAFKAEKIIYDKFFNINNKLKKNNIVYVATNSFLSNIVSFVSVIIPFFILFIGVMFVMHNLITVGTLISIYTFSSTIFSPLSSLINIIPLYKELQASIDRVNNYFESIDGIQYKENIITTSGKKEILLKNLSIGYKQPIVQNINYVITPGLVYVKGNNGIGKSTLAKTIAGLIKPINGNVYIKGYSHVEYISVDSSNISNNILEDIKIGLSKVDVKKLNYLKHNLQLKFLYENNLEALSTGQIQIVKILRALLSKNDIIIFDEIISNLSKSIQSKIYNYLYNEENKIIIIIDHNIPDNIHWKYFIDMDKWRLK